MYAATGETAKVQISKVNDTAVTSANVENGSTITNLTNANYNSKVMAGGMYTFVEKNGALELTKLDSNVIGTMTFDQNNAPQYQFKHSATTPKVGGMVIADDAVVMVYSTNGDGKSAYITGADLKAWKTDWGQYYQILSTTVNGVKTAQVVALYDDAAIPGSTGTTGYGYVTADAYYVKENDTGYAMMTIWTQDGEITVRAEGYGAGNTAPTAANVASQPMFDKGAFVSYEKLTNGNIANVTVVGTAYALTGYYVDRDGETVLTLDADGAPGSATQANVTDDTQIVYVDTENVTGAEGGRDMILAQETAVSGYYVLNVMAVISAGEVSAIFLDVNNNLASNAGLSAFSPSGTVTAFNSATGTVTINANTTAATVATDVTTAFGALAAQLNDTNGDGDSDSGESVTIVAKDGTVVTYTIA